LIPLYDLELERGALDAVADVVASGRLRQGERVEAFERAFADHLGCRHAVAVSSCTAALHLAYLAAGVGPGDEVIVPAFTFVATAAAVVYCGADPVFADITSPLRPSIDPDEVAARITPRTRAVVAVHFAGFPAAVDRLRALCDEHSVALIEDVAHAPSATLGGRKLGTFGTAGAFSFFSNKILSCGEGGLLSTNDDEIAERARRLRSADADGEGFECRLDETRAALLLWRLGRLEEDIERRRALVRAYRPRLAAIPGIGVPYDDDEIATSSCYVMPIMVEDLERRQELRNALREEHGVQTSVFYPAIHEFTAYRDRFPGLSLPQTERAARAEVTLPLFPHMTEEQVDRVVGGIEAVMSR
jgi:dTDP-4-amino-4,6-dideoxygalactose transaminase